MERRICEREGSKHEEFTNVPGLRNKKCLLALLVILGIITYSAILKPQAVSHTDSVACTNLTIFSFGNRSTHVNPAMKSIHTVYLFKIYFARSPAALVYPCKMIRQHSLLSAPWKEMQANKTLYQQCLFPALCGCSVSTVYLGSGVIPLLKQLLLWLAAELLFHYIIVNQTCYFSCIRIRIKL